MKNTLRYPLLLALAAPAASHAASFDCAKASAWAERAICAESSLGELDDQLAARYGSALARSDSGETLKNQQAAWVRDTRNACTSAGCLKTAYKTRMAELDKLIAASPPELVEPGRYRRYLHRDVDPAKAEIFIQAVDRQRFTFEGSVASGSGKLKGAFTPRVGAAELTDGACTAKLLFGPGLITISDATPACPQAGGGFNGNYRKVTK